MSSDRVSRSRSVGVPSRIPRAIGVQIPNTLSAPMAEEVGERRNEANANLSNPEGAFRELANRISDVESNLEVMIENQLKTALQGVMSEYLNRERVIMRNEGNLTQRGEMLDGELRGNNEGNYSRTEETRGRSRDNSRSRGEKRNFKIPKVKIEPKLNGPSNFNYWRLMMEGQMKATNIFSAINQRLDENDEMNLVALDFIVRSVGNQMIPLVLDTKTAYDAWDKIKNYCAPKNASEIRRIRKQLALKEMEGKNIDGYIMSFKKLYSELCNQGILIQDDELISYILNGLPNELSTIAALVENQAVNFEDACSKLRSMIKDMKDYTGGSDKYSEKGLFAQNEKNSKNSRGQSGRGGRGSSRGGVNQNQKKCYVCGDKGHLTKNCKYVRCHSCKKEGHTADKCTEGRNNKKNEGQSDDSDFGLMLQEVALKGGMKEIDWILDSGCSSHVCREKNLFVNFKQERRLLGQLDKSNPIISYGIGSIKLQSLKLDDVLYVPDSGYNLISVSRLTKNNLNINFDENGAKIEGAGIDLHFILRNNIYVLSKDMALISFSMDVYA